jgi:hypothetical protein
LFGAVFLYQGFTKQSYLVDTMKQENITLGMLGINGPEANQIIDSASTAQLAGETVREHRHSIASNYEELLGGKQFDPSNPKELTYAQAINLENYLFLGVAAFGMVDIALATGGFMLVTALAMGATGFTLLKLASPESYGQGAGYLVG